MDDFDSMISEMVSEVRCTKTPRKRVAHLDYVLREHIADTWGNRLDKYIDGWKFYVVDQTRGWCKYKNKYITIPVWVLRKGRDFGIYYIAHEIAHIISGHGAKHGHKFMRAFRTICPEHLQHYETEYKPAHAAAAGIASKASEDALTAFMD